jgi:hypothetical protein
MVQIRCCLSLISLLLVHRNLYACLLYSFSSFVILLEAKRQSMWDAMFMGIRSMGRDESMIEYGFKILMQVLLNFSIGLMFALVFFIIGLWSIVRSYQPNPIVAVFFFIGAACAGFTFVVTYLMALYGAAAGGVYGVLKLAETQARAARIDQQGQQQYMGNRPHHQ